MRLSAGAELPFVSEREEASQHRTDEEAIGRVAGERRGWPLDLLMEAPAAMAVLRGPDHVYELVNPKYEYFVGKDAAQLLGKPGRLALPDLARQGVWDVFDRIFTEDEAFNGEEFAVNLPTPDGRSFQNRYFNFIGQPTHDAQGRVDGILIHAVEVTEQVHARRQVEELARQLETERARLDLGQRVGKIGTYDRDLITGQVIWTPGLEALYGYEPGELQDTGVDWIELVHPEDRTHVRDAVNRSKVEHAPISVEFRITRKDGRRAWLLSEGLIQFDDNGEPVRVVGINVDITERKQAEENLAFLSEASRLLSSSLHYETTLETVANLAVPRVGDWCAIDIIGADGELQSVAVAHRDPKKVALVREFRTRLLAEQSVPAGLLKIMETGHAALYPRITDEMIVAAARNEDELALSRSLNYTSAMTVPIWSRGVPIGVLTLVTSESRRTYTEADLSMAEELASRASLAIDNARLYREAQDALSVRNEFISIASHELKTPVTSLKIYSQMLGRQAVQRGDVQAAHQLERMEKQIDRLSRLVGDLLDVSKIEAGKLEYDFQTFDLADLVRECVELPQSISGRHDVMVTADDSVTISGDRERISQILINLLSNAAKYSPEADRIEVRVTRHEDVAHVAVRDFGVGIDPAFHDQIFNRFYQVADLDQRTFPGLGMGLFISREIARHHGGDIRLESRQNEGSTFVLELPLSAPITSPRS